MNIFKKWLFRKSREQAQREAYETYQIKEYDGKLWLTYNSALICPTTMLNGYDSVSALVEIRNLYVERNATDYDPARETESL